jgi:hypothetical protein
MVNVRAPDVPPPGVGLKTRTEAVPAVAISAAPIVAWSWVAETYVVGRSRVFQRTTEDRTKFVPVTVRVKSPPPASVEVGERLAFVGDGLLIVRVSALVEGTPLVTTVTWAVPAVVMSVAGMAAVTRVALT